jgi:hypothetical protein
MNKTAKIDIKLKAETGFTSKLSAHISETPWADINAVIEGKPSSVANDKEARARLYGSLLIDEVTLAAHGLEIEYEEGEHYLRQGKFVVASGSEFECHNEAFEIINRKA